jgi:hypothetical protein
LSSASSPRHLAKRHSIRRRAASVDASRSCSRLFRVQCANESV